jgi:hypothetical protein
LLPEVLPATRLPVVQTVLESGNCDFPLSTEMIGMASDTRIGGYTTNLSISVDIKSSQIFQKVDVDRDLLGKSLEVFSFVIVGS